MAAVLGITLGLSGGKVSAQQVSQSLANDPKYLQALRALREGIPQVTIQKLNECLAAKLSADDRATVTLNLSRALLAANRAEDALKTLQPLPASNSSANILKAQTLVALGRWNEACPIFHQLATQNGASVSYRIVEAECLHAMGRTRDAIRILESAAREKNADVSMRLRLADFYLEAGETAKCEAMFKEIVPAAPAEAKWKSYIEARLLLSKRRYPEALGIFKQMLGSKEGLSRDSLIGATLGVTDCTLVLSGPEMADNVIEEFISLNPDIEGLDVLFRRLDQIYAREKAPSLSELQKWAVKNPPVRCSAYAAYYLARSDARNGKQDEAMAALNAFVSMYPGHPLLADAWLLRGNILSEQKKSAAALAAYESAIKYAQSSELLAEAEMSDAAERFNQHDFAAAQKLFRSAARHSESLWQKAMFNSALSWLYQANYDRFMDDYKELSARFPESELRSELLLEEGLLQARSGDSRAERTLQIFTRDFPKHPRAAEARLALAEIEFLSPDQNLNAANRYLKVSNEMPRTGETRERADYLAIFLADAGEKPDEEKVIRECKAFIKAYPSSPLLADVSMKLGQVYFRRQDFANARAQFELLAHDTASPFAEPALFLAGQSAIQMMNTDQALEIFGNVVKLNGPLKLYARQQQAILKSRLRSKQGEQDAIGLYDEILNAKPDTDLKFAALCGKGDNYFLLGTDDPKSFDKAIAAYNDLANQPDATAYWRNQALYKKGKCFDKQGKQNEALAAFYDVLQPQTGRNSGPEYLWYYRAGFDAAQMLSAQEQWKPAIAIYQKMAAAGGPRSGEAKALLTQMRLEHFIWDEQ